MSHTHENRSKPFGQTTQTNVPAPATLFGTQVTHVRLLGRAQRSVCARACTQVISMSFSLTIILNIPKPRACFLGGAIVRSLVLVLVPASACDYSNPQRGAQRQQRHYSIEISVKVRSHAFTGVRIHPEECHVYM